METSNCRKIARGIAFTDEIWSVVDLLLTFITFFGGEKANGLFYQVDHHAHLGDIEPEQVTGKKALAGLLFFISLLINLLWIFAAFMLFKGTEVKDCASSSYQKELRCCKIWFYTSILLLFVHGVNVVIYVMDSILETALALVALFARSVFMCFVRKYVRELHEGPSSHQPIYLLYALPNANTVEDRDEEEASFIPTIVTQQRNESDAGPSYSSKINTSVLSNGTHHRVVLTSSFSQEGADGEDSRKNPRSMSNISEDMYELDIEDYSEGPAIMVASSCKANNSSVPISRSHPMSA